MRTLTALTVAYVLTASTPQIVNERLTGFTIFPPNVLRLEYDLNEDGQEDLRVFYRFELRIGGYYTDSPFMYFQDLNFNGVYEEKEKFKLEGV